MSYNLLIVDDKKVSRRNLRIFFEQFGHQGHLKTGEDAVDLMAQVNFDVVISDLRLPGSANGLDVLKQCARTRPETGLILITSFGSDDVRSQADKLGALYYEKPISLDEVRAGIGIGATQRINERAEIIDKMEGVEENVIDLYGFVRDAYLQHRAAELRK